MGLINNIYLGKILEIRSNTDFEFYLNNDSSVIIDDLIGFEIEESIWIVAQVTQIRVSYYLKDSELYFISKASKNQLNDIEPSETKYALIGRAFILGYFKEMDNELIPLTYKSNYYTPKPLQNIYKLEFSNCTSVFGLKNIDKEFCFGNITYPYEGHKVYIDKNNFYNKHTLISGITGIGKTRLASNLIKSIIGCDGHIWIIDPHFEYLNLLHELTDRISIFSRKKYSIKNSEFIELSKDIGNKEIYNLFFSTRLIDAYTLCEILPNISVNQEELIHKVFNTVDLKKLNRTEDILNEFIYLLQQKILIKEEEINSLIVNNSFVKVWEINKYIETKNENSDFLFKAYQGLINRINEFKENGLFKNEIPSWLEKKKGWIDIIAEDYSSDIEGIRFINSLILQFLNGGVHPKFSTIVIDEAHQLFKIKNEKSIFHLNRLLREARKFNLSIVFITQNTNDLPEDLLAQFANHFRFRENNDKDLKNLNPRTCRVSLFQSNTNFLLNVIENNGFIKAN